MRLDLQKNILAIVQRVTLCMIQILVELNNYQIMSRLMLLVGSLIIISASFYPLYSLIDSFGDIEHKVSTLAIGLIIVWLVVAFILGLLLFYFTCDDIIEEKEEKYIQLHFKGAVYTVPEIYQVRGLHNSSSLYKITIAQRGISRFGDRCQNAGRLEGESKEDLAYKLSTQSGLVAQLVRATDS